MRIRTSIGMVFSKLGIPANVWTFLIILPGLASLYFLTKSSFIPAAFSFLLAMIIDVIDGAVARVTTKVTSKGSYLDHIISSYLEVFVLVGLLFSGLPDLGIPASSWIVLALFGFIGMEYSSILAKEKGLLERDWMHFIIKPTSMLLLFLIMIAAAFSQVFASTLLATTATISLIAMLNRQIKAVVQ